MTTAACTCPIRWRRLYTTIEGIRYEVKPAPADTPTSLLFRAWCAGCGAEFTYPFRVDPAHDQAA
ncbi:hypothetical protein DLJ47_17905 [Micromonospora sp. S4605]|uniref:hypothetical protein n=1 Tax=Micromonospora sp. S4605 TaxID=1420897 RepID=UPI000D6F6F59|nr:hypothetical protein [Micromonospora sp. S4605]PWU52728.1 hypothetical protein DLJ47_17905 [Micromonospora sp. S4605]